MTEPVKLIGKECKFVTYVPPPDYGSPDLHVVKEVLHYSDGTLKSNLHTIENYKREFYVTKPGMRNHESKKEWEDKSNLIVYKSTDAQLAKSIARALGNPGAREHLRHLHSSPYVYGSDILGTALIKSQYAKKYDLIKATEFSVGVCDTETDVLHGTNEIIMASFTCKSVVYTAVVKSFLTGYADIERKLDKLMELHLGDLIKKRNLKCELILVDDAIDAVVAVINKAHEVKPDFLAFWNIDFDMTKIIQACEKADIDPATIFSDPSIPPKYRYFKYKRGSDKKVTASGKVTPVKPANRWHTVFTPASFYPIDAMCAYRHIRLAFQELQSYSLDFILKHEDLKGKLKFTEADEYTGLKWHLFMQKNYPLEYIVYNRYDCISIELLDEKTGDLRSSLPMYSGFSDFQFFRSQPRRIVDDLHFEVQKFGKVIGTTATEMTDEDDLTTGGLEGWINN